MQQKNIKKKSGGYRTVYLPDNSRKKYLQSLLPILNEIQKKLSTNSENKIITKIGNVSNKVKTFPIPIIHGFFPNRSPVTNANAHINFNYTLSMDIKDCFDSTTEEMLLNAIGDKVIKRHIKGLLWALFEESRPRQGLPTSPILANIAMTIADYQIMTGLYGIWRSYISPKSYFDSGYFFNIPYQLRISEKNFQSNYISYTRFADDMTISSNNYELLMSAKNNMQSWIEESGYNVNERKTRFQNAIFGNRVITGVSVGSSLKASRYVRRKLRAAIHQDNTLQINGLDEWCKLKMPRCEF